MNRESPVRSILKGLTWRILATGILVFIVYLVEGHIETALRVGFVEFFGKLFIYFVHERIWARILNGKKQTSRISLIKTIVWRILASLTTMLIVIGETNDGETTLIIGVVEFFLKFIVYYLHERAWQLLPLGTIRNIIRK